MDLQLPLASTFPQAGPTLSPRPKFRAEDVVLRRLVGATDIASVLHLREEIDLSVHAAQGGRFLDLEKKETKRASWSRSTCVASASAPSASFRSAMG